MFKNVKKILLSLLFFIFPRLGNNASILMYHSIGGNKAFFTVSLENFEKQLLYLKKNNFKMLKLSELFNRLNSGQSVSNCVSVTFDDGYKDNILFAYPLLKKYNIPATIFVSTFYIGQTMTNSEGIKLPMMTEEDIRNFKNDELIEFLPHTHTHKNLIDHDAKGVVSELENSVNTINQIINYQVPLILAYPKGKYNQSVVDILQSKKWLGAVTVHMGLVNQKTNHYLLPRNSVDSSTSFMEFKAKLSKAILCYNALK